MFDKYSSNIKPLDSYIRIVLATLILIYAIYISCYLLALISIYLYYTGVQNFCFIYYFFKINDKFNIKNHYLSLLPKHNPSAVFIFDIKGQVLFRNGAASKELSKIETCSDIGIQEQEEIILKGLASTVLFDSGEKFYHIDLQGISKEKFLLAYLTDVTEVIELNDAIEETQREVIYAMGEIGETRSKETGNHVKRVALYSELLAQLHGMDEKEASLLKMASPMHDIGKVGIPDAILHAPRKLTMEEFEIMKTHASLGFDMLKSSNKPILQAAAIVANEHHEKYDGSGYPNSRSGEEIHIFGRITAIADVFDALGSDRVYKKAWKLEDILEFFNQERGKHFDPKLVKLFMSNLDMFLEIRERYKG